MTSDTYLPSIGGAEVHVYELQTRLRAAGHHVTLFVADPRPHEEDGEGVHRDWWRLHRAPALWWKMWKLSKGADVYHSHYSYRLAVLNGMTARLRRKPFIVTLHGLGVLDHPNTPFIFDMMERFYRRASLALATQVISTSQDLADVAARFTSKKKILVIPNGLDTSAFRPQGVEKVLQVTGGPLILTVRRLVPKNGIHYAISAMPYVLRAFPDAKLVMVGDGRMREELEDRAQRLGVSHACMFMGTRPNQEIPKIAMQSDAVLFPSTAESTSIACAEMMSLEKPIIASRVGGLIELLGSESERGWLVRLVDWESCNYDAPMELPEDRYVEFAETIVRVLKDPLSSQKCRVARKYAVENLDWGVIVRKTMGVYGLTSEL